MSKVVVVDHHHDADAGVYRLTFAHQEEYPTTTLILNPDFDEGTDPGDDNLLMIEQQDVQTMLLGSEEIVWDADDERWKGKDADAIAAEQRQIVKEMLAKRAAEAEQAEVNRKDLGGAGEEL